MSDTRETQAVKVLHGLDSDLQFYGDKIVFHCANWLSRLLQGDRTILLGELDSVTLDGSDHERRPFMRLDRQDGKPVVFVFNWTEWQTAQELQSRLDYEIGRRGSFPPPKVSNR